jgi:hypothetical protein
MSKIAKRLAVSLALGLTTIASGSTADAAARKHHPGYARAYSQPGYARENPQRSQADENAWMDYVSRPSPGL